jgi:hypothetical protein
MKKTKKVIKKKIAIDLTSKPKPTISLTPRTKPTLSISRNTTYGIKPTLSITKKKSAKNKITRK